MKRYSSWEIARIRARRAAAEAREQARQAEARERARTEALIAAAVLGTIAWVGLMAWGSAHLIDLVALWRS